MKLSDYLTRLAAALDAPGAWLDAPAQRQLARSLRDASRTARRLEAVSEEMEAVAQDLDLFAFAATGAPRPSAEVIDLTEEFRREQARPADPAVREPARILILPTVRRCEFAPEGGAA